MRYFQILSLLACAQLAIASPVSLEVRAKGTAKGTAKAASQDPKPAPANSKNVTKDSVSRAADNFAQDAGIVSNAINQMTSMTDQDAIKATAQRAFDAESDEDNQRQILAAAAGSAGDSANGKIMKFTPTVLNGLDAITKDPSPDSVQQNTKMMEDPRNANILPSIMQLSNAALGAMGLDQTAPELKLTTGASGNGNSNNGNNNNNNSSSSSSNSSSSSSNNNNNNSSSNSNSSSSSNNNSSSSSNSNNNNDNNDNNGNSNGNNNISTNGNNANSGKNTNNSKTGNNGNNNNN